MEILHYTIDDLVLSIVCQPIGQVYEKAGARIKNIGAVTRYRVVGGMGRGVGGAGVAAAGRGAARSAGTAGWDTGTVGKGAAAADLDTGAGRLTIWSPGGKDLLPVSDVDEVHPLFFENTEYGVEIIFTGEVERPRIQSRLRAVTERFNPRKRGSELSLSGAINFGNDIGASEIVLLYEKKGVPHRLVLEFEVFPIKLDLRSDHRIIVTEVEAEYSRMALDLLKKTWIGFRTNPGTGNDLTWWVIFGFIFRELMSAMRYILDNPHIRLAQTEEFRKREQLKSWSPALEEELLRHRDNPSKFYKVPVKSLSHDTIENRFLKHVAIYAYGKFAVIRATIEKDKKKIISKDYSAEMEETGRQLKKLLSHPLFVATGEFRGMTQESAVLQKKAGYSNVYRAWIFLRRSLSLFEGIRQIETKNIADLYQFWCFLKMKNKLAELLGRGPEHINLAPFRKEGLLYPLRRGADSRVLFVSARGDTIELFHDLSYDHGSPHGHRVFTEIQRPDITLRITKKDLPAAHVFTYVYDAKYRVEISPSEEGGDRPPVDAINQMHRYRDAIYHLDVAKGLGRAVVGGYILFPGSGSVETVRLSPYYSSIAAVGIGGFPLLPDDREGSGVLLEGHLREILSAGSQELLARVIPHKGLQYEEADGVVMVGDARVGGGPADLVGFPEAVAFAGFTAAAGDGRGIYLLPLLDVDGKVHPIDLGGGISYFAPAGEEGVQAYYQVDRIGIERGVEMGLPGEGFYYVFYLSGRKELDRVVTVELGGGGFLFRRLSELG